MHEDSTLYLHIGFWKTGTTTIQDSMFLNRDILAEFGICYPSLSKNHTFLASAFHPTPENFIVARSKSLASRELNEWHISSLEKFEKEIEGFKKVIVSSEFLLDLPEKAIVNLYEYLLKKFSKVFIVVYLRDPVSHLCSSINEQVKQGHYSLDKAYEIHSRGVEYKKLKNWIKVYGEDNVKVRVLESSLLKGSNLLEDFLSVVDEDCLILSKHGRNKNRTLSHAAILIANELAIKFPSFSKERGKTDYLHEIRGVGYKAPLDLQKEVYKEHSEDYNYYRTLVGENKKFEPVFLENKSEDVWSRTTICSIAEILNDFSNKLAELNRTNLLLEARLLQSQGKNAEALKKFRILIERKEDFEVFRDFANFLYNQSILDEALIMCDKAISLKPDREWPRKLRKSILESMKESGND